MQAKGGHLGGQLDRLGREREVRLRVGVAVERLELHAVPPQEVVEHRPPVNKSQI